MTLRLSVVGRSDVGLVRALNEDSGYAAPEVALVADGMGGHAAGEVASRIVAETVVARLTDGPASGDMAADLVAAVSAAEAALAEAIRMDGDLGGMGTTLTLARLIDATLLLAHVGDSRAYLYRDGVLTRATRDHTFVQQLVDEGSLDPAEVAAHPARSVLTQAMDGSGRAVPDISTHPVAAGDRVLLCSDGLSGVVDLATLGQIVGGDDLAEAADQLIAAALAGGAPDNVTAVLAEVVDDGDGAAAAATVWLGAAAPRGTEPDIPPLLPLPQTVEVADEAESGTDAEVDTGRHGAMALFGGLLMAAGLLGTLFAVAHVWASQQWYVAEAEGRAAIIHGLPEPLLGLPTGGPVTISEVRLGNLPATERQRLADGIAAADQTEAEEILDRIRRAEAACLAAEPAAGCPA